MRSSDSSPPSICLRTHITKVILKPFKGRPGKEAKTDPQMATVYLSWWVLFVSLHLLQSVGQQMTLVSLSHGPPAPEGSHQFFELQKVLQHSFGPWGELIQLSDPQWRSWQPSDPQGVRQLHSFVLRVVSFLRSLSPLSTDSFLQIGWHLLEKSEQFEQCLVSALKSSRMKFVCHPQSVAN